MSKILLHFFLFYSTDTLLVHQRYQMCSCILDALPQLKCAFVQCLFCSPLSTASLNPNLEPPDSVASFHHPIHCFSQMTFWIENNLVQ